MKKILMVLMFMITPLFAMNDSCNGDSCINQRSWNKVFGSATDRQLKPSVMSRCDSLFVENLKLNLSLSELEISLKYNKEMAKIKSDRENTYKIIFMSGMTLYGLITLNNPNQAYTYVTIFIFSVSANYAYKEIQK